MAPAWLSDEADFVIVGTGAGGATAARVLTAAGHSVAMLEAGPSLPPGQRPRELLPAMATAFRDFSTGTTRGPARIPIVQGRCVGGSTAINSGIIWRLPEDVRRDWTDRFGLGELVDEAALDRIFGTIEEELEIADTADEVQGNNGLKMKEAAATLGLPGKPIRRNARRCAGSNRCLQGCPNLARQSMDTSYVPKSLAAGGRLHALARASRVAIRGGRARGVEGELLDPETRKARGTFEVLARRAVIVAAGAIDTPVLLRRSGLRGLVGERFQAHPGAAVVGRFRERIGMSFGATQGYEVPMRERGFKLESISMPAEMMGTRLPGAGAEWQERLAHLDEFGQWAAQVRMRAMGRVRPGLGGYPTVKYQPLAEDVAKLREGVALLCRMMFAAGAVEVYPGVGRRPEILNDVEQVRTLEEGPLEARDFHMIASHLFGTACAGADPARSVVGPGLECHEVGGLYVMDASVFPTNLGVNPQHSIMGVVWRAAERLAAAA